MTLLQHTNLNTILVMIYCFVDDFIKGVLQNIRYALKRPDRNTPPLKKRNLSIAELSTLAIFRFFTGHKNWKDFYRHLKTYHTPDFPKLPKYGNFIEAVNVLSPLADLMLQGFMHVFRQNTREEDPKLYEPWTITTQAPGKASTVFHQWGGRSLARPAAGSVKSTSIAHAASST